MSDKSVYSFMKKEESYLGKGNFECTDNKKCDISKKVLSISNNNCKKSHQKLKRGHVDLQITPNYKKEYLKLKKELDEKNCEIKLLRDLLKKIMTFNFIDNNM